MRQMAAGFAAGLALAAATIGGAPGGRTTVADDSTRVRVVRAAGLPALDGTRLHTTLVEVHYGPGGSSKPHSHPCPVVGYVVDGALRTQVQGEAEAVYHAGESFYEAPNGVHLVSANASATAPVTFLAWFVCDRETPLAVPAGAAR